MRNRRLLIVEVRPHIPDVRIRQANDLSRIARIGKDFLVSCETGIENNFAAAPGAGPCGASSKNSSVFECKSTLPCTSFSQRILFSGGLHASSRRRGTFRVKVEPPPYYGFIFQLRREPEWNRSGPPANMRIRPCHK